MGYLQEGGYNQMHLLCSCFLCLQAKVKELGGEQSPKMKGSCALNNHVVGGLTRNNYTELCPERMRP